VDAGLRHEATLNRAVTAFETLVEKLKQACNLRFNMIDISTDGRRDITLSNRAMLNSGVTLVLIFDDEIADAFNIPRQRSFIFNLETIRSYTLKLPEPGLDILDRHSPLTLISVGIGQAKSWLEGRGYVPLTAVRYRGGKIMSTGAVINVNQSHVTFEMVTSGGERVVLDRAVNLDLMLKFSRMPQPAALQ
jgi:hypothetical protein